MNHDEFDIERELRENRPQPSDEYTKALAGEVRGPRTRQSRFGLGLAVSGLIVVAVASFGGIGMAASSAPNKPAVKDLRIVKSSAASAQYESVKPPKATTKPAATKPPKAAAAAAVKVQKAAPKVTTSQLPFTGLTLWVPLAVGLMLIAFGLVLRTRSRRRHTSAH